jgi:hypothetical protein
MWDDLLWTILIYALVVAIIFWAWGRISSYVPEPFKMVLFVLGVVLMALLAIGFLTSRVGLIPCCVVGGVQLL